MNLLNPGHNYSEPVSTVECNYCGAFTNRNGVRFHYVRDENNSGWHMIAICDSCESREDYGFIPHCE